MNIPKGNFNTLIRKFHNRPNKRFPVAFVLLHTAYKGALADKWPKQPLSQQYYGYQASMAVTSVINYIHRHICFKIVITGKNSYLELYSIIH
jgi:hypothetical protein